jgi:fructose-1,6-bisphosphatase
MIQWHCRTGREVKASDGFNRIMELQPTELHEEFLFSVAAIMVEKAGEFGT